MSSPKVSLLALMCFVLEHPLRDNLLKGYDSLQHLQTTFVVALERNHLIVVTNSEGQIDGIGIVNPCDTDKSLLVELLITKWKSRGIVKLLLQHYHNNFTGYKLCAYRDNEFIAYNNTKRFLQLLNNL